MDAKQTCLDLGGYLVEIEVQSESPTSFEKVVDTSFEKVVGTSFEKVVDTSFEKVVDTSFEKEVCTYQF